MTEKFPTPDTPPLQLSDWDRLAERKSPKLQLWMLASGIVAGAMLYVSPVASSSHVLVSIGVVLLASLVLWLGWITGVSYFAASCEFFRRGAQRAPLAYVLPILLAAIVALGLLGGPYWWLLSIAAAIHGFRKGTRRAWWSAVTCLGFGLRSLDQTYGSRLYATDEDALATAMDLITKETRSGPKWKKLNDEATSHYRQRHYDRAVVVAEKALQVAEQATGPDHPGVARSIGTLALPYKAQGQFAQDEPLLKRSLAINEKAYGPDHPVVALSLNALALLYYIQGQFGQAEPLFKRSLAIREKALGPDHPDVASSLEQMALLYLKTGQDNVAQDLAKRAAAIRAIER